MNTATEQTIATAYHQGSNAVNDQDSMLSGLTLLPKNTRAAINAICASILFVTAFISMIDEFALRGLLLPQYVAFETSPLGGRTFATCMLAGIEEIRFRLVLMTILIALLTLWRGKLSTSGFIAVIVVTQFANVAHILVHQPLYGTLRYLLVGCVWGLLYWKHGWLSAFAGHTVCHLMLDPVLLIVLLHS